MSVPRTVGVLLNLHVAYCRSVWTGVSRYALQADWRLKFQVAREFEHETERVRWLESGVHGLILQIVGPALARLAQSGLPAVNVSTALRQSPAVPTVSSDNYALGRAAAEHLLQQPLSQFAYFGEPGRYFTETRGRGFIDTLRRAGHPCATLSSTTPREIVGWVESLPKPVGLFAASDATAASLLSVCLGAGVEIRGRVAIVGVDNAVDICEATFPRLTSVAQQAERIGWEAARTLDGMMNRSSPGAPRAPDLLFPPESVVVRESSVLQAVDAELAEALKFIRNNVRDIEGVDDLAKRLSLSRRTLERRFQTMLGRSPLEEIRRVRMVAARQLLTETNLAVAQIARECGFGSATRMGLTFQQVVGCTPSAYRRRVRHAPEPDA